MDKEKRLNKELKEIRKMIKIKEKKIDDLKNQLEFEERFLKAMQGK